MWGFKSFSFLGRKIGKWLFMFKLRVSCLLFVRREEDKVSLSCGQHKALPGYLPSHFYIAFFLLLDYFYIASGCFFSPTIFSAIFS